MNTHSFSPCLSLESARMLSPLQLAYVGDSVHALLTRTQLIEKNLLVRDMHKESNGRVSAVSQAKELRRALPYLTQEECEIVKRGRNAHSHPAPKSATPGQYARATGLETLFGWLWLTGQHARVSELYELGKERPK